MEQVFSQLSLVKCYSDVFTHFVHFSNQKTAEVEAIEYSGGTEIAAHSIYKNYIDDELITATK